ncbi:MAG: exopolysaccharide biosynthesis polyprenyl glycosylphosphotransferase [bacterium]|nr:exopolysaccharide biosynthesis polyprenyl glycosylphosphotransferase [bacterium]
MPAQAKKILILFGDIAILYFSLFVTVYLRYSNVADSTSSNFTTSQLFSIHVQAFTPLILIWLLVFYIHNLYEITSAKNSLEFYSGLARSLAVNFLAAVLFFYFANFTYVAPKTNLFIYFGIFSVLFTLWRGQVNIIFKKNLLLKTFIISDNEKGEKLAVKLNQNPQIGYRVEAVINADSSIGESIKEKKIGALIVDDRFFSKEGLAVSLYNFIDKIEVITLDKFNERVWRKINLANVNHIWFLNNIVSGKRSFYETTKRFFDFILAILLTPILFSLGLLIILIIKIEGDGPIFYRQIRVGHKGKNFNLIKFRTMRQDAEKNGAQWTIENDSRVTKVGRFLRKARLDELPQLINILKGEMSFVGPRAERPEFHQLLVKEIPFYDRRYLVKPGLTGWAQINYTYGSSVEDTKEKLSYDFYYLKNRSFIFDVGIILKTANIVLAGLGR